MELREPLVRTGWPPVLAHRGRAVCLGFAVVVGALTVLGVRGALSGHSAPAGVPVSWQAFYDPATARVLVHPNSGLCGTKTHVTEEDRQLKVSVREIPVRPGHGACVSPLTADIINLHSPVSSRRIVAADTGVSGEAFDLTTRLHQPRGSVSAPQLWGATATRLPAGGWIWTLAYAATGPSASYVLQSRPVAGGPPLRTASLRVRGHPTVTPCNAVICWHEGSFLYTIGAPNVVAPVPTVDAAIAIADTLVSTP